jgi:Flp pilus assembly protein TadD
MNSQHLIDMALPVFALFAIGCATAAGATSDPGLRAPSPGESSVLREELIEAMVAKGSTATAVPLLKQALKESPRSAHLHTLLGVVLRDRGVRDQAEKELEIAIELDPKQASAHGALGVLYDYSRRHDLALKEHREAVRIAPDCVRCWNNLGFSLYLQHRDREAVAAFQAAIRLDPNEKAVYNNLGFAYGRLGYSSAALRAFRVGGDEAAAHQNLELSQVASAPAVASETAVDPPKEIP